MLETITTIQKRRSGTPEHAEHSLLLLLVIGTRLGGFGEGSQGLERFLRSNDKYCDKAG